MADYLLSVHVGPVQDFIASARRCRDLWYGSQMLSEASRAVAQLLTDGNRPALIFPGEVDRSTGGDVSVANKIQVYLADTDVNAVRDLAEAGRAALDKWVKTTSDEVFERIEHELPAGDRASFDGELARAQVAELFEYYWVAVPVAEPGDYARSRKECEQLLAARKNTRRWSASTFVRFGVPKSALDGVRESVIHESCFSPEHAAWLYRIFKVGKAERLCGVGLLKRNGRWALDAGCQESTPTFHSTSHIASAPLRVAMAGNPAAQGAWNEFVGMLVGVDGFPLQDFRIRSPQQQPAWTEFGLPAGDNAVRVVPHVLPGQHDADGIGLDGELLYPERLQSMFDDFGISGDQQSVLTNAQQKVLRALGIGDPFAYYALILADGDKMGVAIDRLAEHAGADGRANHKRMSKTLDAEFTSTCASLVRKHGGSLLYAGGDDVMAMVPVVSALACARALRDRFRSAMEKAFAPLDESERPTLSVGVAVVHHMDRFDRARQYAKKAESAAKDGGRNSLAVVLKKRSGPERLVVGKWLDGDEEGVDRRILRWTSLLLDNRLPSRFASRLRDEIAPLRLSVDGDAPPSVAVEDLVRKMVQLVVQRGEGGAKGGEGVLRELESLYDTYLEGLGDKSTRDASSCFQAVDLMIDELRIAQLMVECHTQAFGRNTPGHPGAMIQNNGLIAEEAAR